MHLEKMSILKPQHLREGDRIGIVSPSSTIATFPQRTERATEALRKLGFDVVFAKNALESFGQNAGTAEQRASDLHEMFSREDVHAIIASTGGYNANAVLPLLDYKLIRQNPKIFCGFSDITVLNLAIYNKTGMATFNGPTLLPSFGDFGGPLDATVSSFKRALMHPSPYGALDKILEISEESLFWDRDDSRVLHLEKAAPWVVLSQGSATGRFIGGNLTCLCSLGGTEYFPNFDGGVLFIEEMGGNTSDTERMLVYLDMLGVFQKIKGLVFGRTFKYTTSSPDRTLFDILKELGSRYAMPVIANVDIGHTKPLLTVPIGVEVEIDTSKELICITEAATS